MKINIIQRFNYSYIKLKKSNTTNSANRNHNDKYRLNFIADNFKLSIKYYLNNRVIKL